MKAAQLYADTWDLENKSGKGEAPSNGAQAQQCEYSRRATRDSECADANHEMREVVVKARVWGGNDFHKIIWPHVLGWGGVPFILRRISEMLATKQETSAESGGGQANNVVDLTQLGKTASLG